MKNNENTGTGTPDSRALTTLRNLRNICDSVREVLFCLDVEANGDCRFSFVNSAFLSTTGLPASRIIGTVVSKILPGSYLELILPKYRSAILEKKSVQWEETNTCFTRQQSLDITISPIFDEHGTCTTIIGTAYDITERKQAEETLRETQEKYQALLEAVPDGVVVVDADGQITEVNQVFAAMSGYQSSELVGRQLEPVIPAEPTSKPEKHPEEHWIQPATREARMYCKNGTEIPVEVKISQGHVKPARQTLAFVRDITERNRTNEVMWTYAEVVKNMAEGTSIVSQTDAIIRWTSAKFEEMFGYANGEMIGQHVSIVNAPANLSPTEKASEIIEIIQRTGEWHGEVQNIRKDGTLFWCYASVSLFEHPVFGPVYLSVHTDITERKLAEDAVRKYAERLQLATRSGNIGIWDWDIVQDELSWDGSMYALYGICQDDFGGAYEAWSRTIHPDDRQRVEEEIRAALEGERDYAPEFRIVRGDGTLRNVQAASETFYNQDGKAERMIGINLDITERKQVEILLKDERDRLSVILDTVGDPIFVKDNDHRILLANRAFYELFNLDAGDVIGKTLAEHVPENERAHFLAVDRQVLDTGQTDQREETLTVGDFTRHIITKKTRFIEASSRQKFLVGSIHDITARKEAETTRAKLENQLQQAQKLESVGRLAGGVAHDFNNMLTVILGNTELGLLRAVPGEPLHNNLLHIQKAAQHSTDLTRQLLAFARKQIIAPKELDLNLTISKTLKMLGRLIGEAIHLIWLPGPNLWPVKVDPSQVDQILANLCINARDAIGESGNICIETENTTFGNSVSTRLAGLRAGDFVRLTVRDDGCGMDEETQHHIFEPFFTTKGVAEGTGLGLATVYGAIKQNNGFIEVSSEPGQGTNFTLYLPRYVGEPIQQQTKGAKVPLRGGRETILLVEDEPEVLNLTTMMLEELGYHILSATSPNEAIRLAMEHQGEIQLLLTDVVLSESNGLILSKKVQAFCPNLKCLFMSGYTADVIAHHGVLRPGVAFLQKPFSIGELATKVRKTLGKAG